MVEYTVCDRTFVYPIGQVFLFLQQLQRDSIVYQQMSFTQVYGNILLPFVKNYNNSKNEKARKGVVEIATNAVLKSRNLLEEKGLELPQDLKAVCPSLITLLNPPCSTHDQNSRPSDGI